MKTISADTVKLLNALLDVCEQHARGQREEATIAEAEFNGLMGGNPKAPYRDVAAVSEALTWCKNHEVAPLPAILVLDPNFKSPQSDFLVEAFGAMPRAKAMQAWHAVVDELAAMDVAGLEAIRAKLPVEEEKKPVRKRAESKAAKQGGSKAAAPGKKKAARASSKDSAVADTRKPTKRAGANRIDSGAMDIPAAKRSSKAADALVTLQQVDAAALDAAYQHVDGIVQEAVPGAGLFETGLLADEREAAMAAWKRWHETLDPQAWAGEEPPLGTIISAIQASVDDEDADWLGQASGVDIALKLRRKDRLDKQPAQTSAKQFEAAVRGFFADELSFNDFLAQMKDLLGRQYALIAHILFLKDATAYVPVDVEPLQAGFKQLGVDLSLTGHCTPVSYQRLLQLLDSVAALISAKEPGVTRLDACMFVRLMGDEAKLAGEN